MSMGLLALLDDVAVLAKVAAASLDDVVAQATKAGTKAAAVVIDDAAVTPSYVVGFSAERELPIVWKIAKASLKNKIIFLMPIAIVLSYGVPFVITPLLILGGAYLCFEGAEKIFESFFGSMSHSDVVSQNVPARSLEHVEKATIAGAIRTDLILSAEIMAISISTVSESPVLTQVVVLSLIAFFITGIVYGTVALIVKMDDMGLALAKNPSDSFFARRVTVPLGRSLVQGMPILLKTLTIVGTLAMAWVGGSIIAHGLHVVGWHWPEETIHNTSQILLEISLATFNSLEGARGFVLWFITTLLQAFFGLFIGLNLLPLVHLILEPIIKRWSQRSM